MNAKCGILILTSSAFALGPSFGRADLPPDYVKQRSAFTISVSSPPTQMWVEDAQGRITGADPSGVLSNVGLGDKVNNIPLSESNEDNIRNDESGLPAVVTTWQARIVDAGNQSFLVHLRGTAAGVCRLYFGATMNQGEDPAPLNVDVFMAVGVERKVRVYFNEGLRIVSATRIVESAQLGDDVDTACESNMIDPQGICHSLKAKASAAESAFKRGNRKAAEGALAAFLRDLKAQDDKHIKEPAASILREEAEALLDRTSTTSLHTGKRKTKK